LDRKKDEDIAQHILKTHQAGETMLQHRLAGGKKRQEVDAIKQSLAPAIEGSLLKKYIAYARQNIFPVLTKESIQAISDYYVDLREQGRKQGTYSATHRQLEGLVRLSEASARIRLSDEVVREDADRAIRLLKASLEDVVKDPETGKIDFDIITMGATHTQLTNMKVILNLVKQRSKDSENQMAQLQDIIDEAKTQGLDEDKTKDLIKKLEDKGEIYRPKYNFLKPTQKEK